MPGSGSVFRAELLTAPNPARMYSAFGLSATYATTGPANAVPHDERLGDVIASGATVALRFSERAVTVLPSTLVGDHRDA